MISKMVNYVNYILLIILMALILQYFDQNQVFAQEAVKSQLDKYTVERISLPDGRIIEATITPSPPTPPIGYDRMAADLPEVNMAAGTNSLSDVPAFNWSFGCSATSAAMIAGYYDRTGYVDMYTGPTNGGVMPLDNSSWSDWNDGTGDRHQCPLSATHAGLDGRIEKGHVDDYWVAYLDAGPDPFDGNWPEHTYGECTGDFMKTNQATYSNVDGSTSFYNYNDGSPLPAAAMEGFGIHNNDGGYGIKLFYESRGYTVVNMYNQRILGQGTDENDDPTDLGFTFDQYKAEIDAGRPVMIHVVGHTMVGVGYDDSTNEIYIHDTWNYNVHPMTWGGIYSGMQHYAVTIVQLEEAPPLDSDGDGVPDSNDLCPGTPQGESVDGNGCSTSQIDSDNDGVNDNIDLCPDTPIGETVDASGCVIPEPETTYTPGLVEWSGNLVADFGVSRGLYYAEPSGTTPDTWTQMTGWGEVNNMVEWDDGTDVSLAVDFGGGRGLYAAGPDWATSGWHKIAGWDDTANMATLGMDLVVDFGGGHGIHTYDGTSFTQLCGWDDAKHMLLWGSNLVVDFGNGRGIYTFDGLTWAKLSGWDTADDMLVWDNELVIDFGTGRGIYTYDGTGWTKLCGWENPEHIVAWGSNLVVDFGQGRGIYFYNGSWNKVSGWDTAAGIVAWGGNLVIDFGGGRGIFSYDGLFFTEMSGWDDAEKIVVTGSDLIVDYGAGRGIYSYDGLIWTKIISWSIAD